jgi:predicted alpha-1,6-mannanase (GH76 family)
VQNGGGSYGSYGTAGTYYTDQLLSSGNQRAGTWIAGLDIAVAEDDYQRTHSPADWTLVNNLVTTFLNDDGTTWTSWDGWNDDIGWMLNATLRGYQITGNTAWLNVAETEWNDAYNRGWTSDGGGGIWENDTDYSKCALSNDPFVWEGVSLYQITGDGSYLTKAEQIYQWVKNSLVEPSGQVNGCIAFPNGTGGGTELQGSDNAYDAGGFIEAADALYRATANSGYEADAALTANHFLNDVPIPANNASTNGSERGSAYQYWLFKGMADYCTDAGDCARYDGYMLSNAAQAWNERNSLGVTWNDWTSPTNDPNPDAFEMTGMVSVFENLPSTAASPFTGSYEIKSNASEQSLGVQGDSGANSAPIVQNPDTDDSGASWTFVPESNGYYEIKNARAGQLLNVNNQSGAPGALIVQWPAGGLVPGNDQWLPVQNADGSWSFYNRDSGLALDDTAGSTAAGTQYEQWSPSNNPNQKFTLVSRANGAAPKVGSGAVTSGIAGKCLDLNGGSASDGTAVQLYTCNRTAAQGWTLNPNGTLQNSGKCLDATANGTGNGTLLDLWDCNGGANQAWQPYDGGYVNPASGRCIDDPNNSAANGTQLELWDCNGGANQAWSLPGASGAVTSGIAGKCLDLNGGSTNDGTAAQLYDCNGTAAQDWTLYSNGTLQNSGKCLDAHGAGTGDGTVLDLWDCNGGANQVWEPYDGGYVNPVSGRCIDDPAASTTNGTQLQLYDCNGSTAQTWSLPGA